MLRTRTRKHSLIGAAALAALAAAVPLSAVQAESVALAGGPRGSIYDSLARRVGERLRESGISVQVIAKPDCNESLAWLEEDVNPGQETRFALAQQDAVERKLHDSPSSPILVVDRIAYDYLHIFVRRSLQVGSISYLSPLRVWRGESGSATRSTAAALLDQLGVTLAEARIYKDLTDKTWTSEPGDLRAEDHATQNLLAWFKNEQLDAALLMSPAGNPNICSLMLHGRVSLLPLNQNEMRTLREALRRDDRVLRQVGFDKLPASTYVNQPEPVQTLVGSTLLVARKDARRALTQTVLNTVHEEWEAITRQSQTSQGCRIPIDPPSLPPISEAGLRLFPGLVRPPEPTVDQPWGLHLAFLGVAGIFLVLAYFKQKTVQRFGNRALGAIYSFLPLVRFLIAFLLIGMVIITFATYRAEEPINENFSSFWESWWSITVYIFSGLEDKAPYTLAGRIFATVGLFLGWICSAIATGWTAGIFVRKERPMPRNVEEHYLLLGWNERGAELVKELLHSVLSESGNTSPVVVVTDDSNPHWPLLKLVSKEKEGVHIKIGDPSDKDILKNVNAMKARAVLLLADERGGDERALRTVIQLGQLARKSGGELHVIVELLNSSNDVAVEGLSQEFPGLLESVSGLRLRTCLLSQAAINKGLVGFFKDLLTVERNSNEVYAVEIPAEADGQKFPCYAAFVMKTMAKQACAVIPVGVQRKVGTQTKIFTNPGENEAGYSLQRGDRLVLISQGPPTIKELPAPPPQKGTTEDGTPCRSCLAPPTSPATPDNSPRSPRDS